MKLSIYKEDLLKNDIPNFINTLEKMKNDNNTYSEIKRLNIFLKDFIESISDKIIEKDNYRIIPYDYSLTYLFSLYLQSKVDFAEYMVQVMKNDRCYSSFKAARKSYDCTVEDNFAKDILNNLIYLLSDYNLSRNLNTNGFKDINEIEYVLKKSNINTALVNMHKIISREYEFKEKFNDDDFDKIIEKNLKGTYKAYQDFVYSTNSLNKINIVHIPLFNNKVPSMYIYNINTILVSESLDNDSIERRLISEFGMYIQYNITNDIMQIPQSFAYEHPLLQGIALKRLYYDLFAYKMLKDTEIADKDKLVQDLKDKPDSLQRLDEYAKYFDILLD